ncbi:unnamed protein product [Polarella glacialis]|uniref:Uncharacterized protein n=1 Tax=Polarella glacialis TaxID=89957 RepID=A0A813GVD5_POLGL|nr:unnamed protein product [Polarella glacialis]
MTAVILPGAVSSRSGAWLLQLGTPVVAQQPQVRSFWCRHVGDRTGRDRGFVGAAAAAFGAALGTSQQPARRRKRVRAKGGRELGNVATVAPTVAPTDSSAIFKSLVLEQVTRGRLLTPWESLRFYVRTSRTIRAFLRPFEAQFHPQWWPFGGKRRLALEGSTVKSVADNSLPAKEPRAPQISTPQKVAMLGTRECGAQHQQEIEMLSAARVIHGDHVYTSGSIGTNSAVIRGVMNAGRPELLTVILPQSFAKQDAESQALLRHCMDAGANVVPSPSNDSLTLAEAAKLCNCELLGHVEKLVTFLSLVPEKSSNYLSLIADAKQQDILTTAFYLD